MIILFVLAMITVAFLQGRVLVRQQQWGELAAFGTLMVVAMVMAFLVVQGIPLPDGREIVVPLLKLIYDFLGIRMLS